MSALDKIEDAAKEQCPDCGGSGQAEPDCSCCDGEGRLTLEELEREGLDPKDCYPWELGCSDVDDWFECPGCHDASCITCMGEGKVEAGFLQRERERLLVTAITPYQEIFPRVSLDFRGHVHVDRNALISRQAIVDLRTEGKAHWFCSIFGDEISLTEDGRREAMGLFDDGTARFLSEAPEYNDYVFAGVEAPS